MSTFPPSAIRSFVRSFVRSYKIKRNSSLKGHILSTHVRSVVSLLHKIKLLDSLLVQDLEEIYR